MTLFTPTSSCRRRAFTLIELLVAVAIIALLIAVLVPSLATARRKARETICMGNMHLLGTGFQSYMAEFEGTLPWDNYAEGDRPSRSVGPWEEPSQWFNAGPVYAGLPSYASLQLTDAAGGAPLAKSGGRSPFICPEAGEPAIGGPGDAVQDGYFLTWGRNADDSASVQRKTYWSYAFNTQLDGAVEDRAFSDGQHQSRKVFQKSTNIPRWSEAVVLIEKLLRPDEFSPPSNSNICQGQCSWSDFTTRHRKGGYLLFLDNHVEFFTRKQITEPPGAPGDYNFGGRVLWNPFGAST